LHYLFFCFRVLQRLSAAYTKLALGNVSHAAFWADYVIIRNKSVVSALYAKFRIGRIYFTAFGTVFHFVPKVLQYFPIFDYIIFLDLCQLLVKIVL